MNQRLEQRRLPRLVVVTVIVLEGMSVVSVGTAYPSLSAARVRAAGSAATTASDALRGGGVAGESRAG